MRLIGMCLTGLAGLVVLTSVAPVGTLTDSASPGIRLAAAADYPPSERLKGIEGVPLEKLTVDDLFPPRPAPADPFDAQVVNPQDRLGG